MSGELFFLEIPILQFFRYAPGHNIQLLVLVFCIFCSFMMNLFELLIADHSLFFL